MTEDPDIKALFGSAPSDIDLDASEVATNNGAVIAMVCLAVVAAGLRFTARVILRNAFMADDWLIIGALIGIGGTAGLSVAGGNVGSGRHIWSTTVDQLMRLYRFLFCYTFVYAASCTCTRLSILFFYRRVFAPFEIWLKVAIIFAVCLTLSYPIIVWVAIGNACQPVSYFWTQFSDTEGKCFDIDMFSLATAILNMLNDCVVLIIPFPRVVKLQMTPRKKLAICAILAVGAFVCIASIVRIYFLSVFIHSTDVTWHMGPLFIWSTIEPAVAIVCACLPHLAPLARLASRSILRSYNSHKATTTASGGQHYQGGSGVGSQKVLFGSRAPTFDYGLDRMKKEANDDEIGLTSHVTAGPIGSKQPSIESGSDDYVPDSHSIAVQSSFVQSTSHTLPT